MAIIYTSWPTSTLFQEHLSASTRALELALERSNNELTLDAQENGHGKGKENANGIAGDIGKTTVELAQRPATSYADTETELSGHGRVVQ